MFNFINKKFFLGWMDTVYYHLWHLAKILRHLWTIIRNSRNLYQKCLSKKKDQFELQLIVSNRAHLRPAVWHVVKFCAELKLRKKWFHNIPVHVQFEGKGQPQEKGSTQLRRNLWLITNKVLHVMYLTTQYAVWRC